MGDKQNRRAALLGEAQNQIHNLASGVLIQIAGRLIGKQNRRIGDKRARQRRALLFPSRHLCRIMCQTMRQPNLFQHGLGFFKCRSDTGKFQRQSNIFNRRHGRHQMKRLEHNADTGAPEPRQRILIHICIVMARHNH